MPAQIFVTREQVGIAHDLGEDVIFVEMPASTEDSMLDIWVMDEEARTTNKHRSVLVDQDGNVIGDQDGVDDHPFP